MPNRLATETSPYLLQHKDNPVDWYPWGAEALDLARRKQRPILVSIGYSACHWCHVMAHESFEEPAIADQVNRDFVAIKVDREERPDIDSIYMSAVQAMSGQGGWPLNVFLTPDGRPFFGGTYWPPSQRGGMPSFPRVLEAVSTAWHRDRDAIVAQSDKVLDHLRATGNALAHGGSPDITTGDLALEQLRSQFDDMHGGFGGAPKFPQASVLEFLLHHGHAAANGDGRDMLSLTLDRMAAGGIYDHLGGGFARYSVDATWLVPHFEKMLYDNAQLISVYLAAWKMTGESRYRDVVEETAGWAIEIMQSAEGGFFSALDADSEGEEGRAYVWSKQEIDALLPEDEANIVARHFGVTEGGNFEGNSILSVVRTAEDIGDELGRPVDAIETGLGRARSTMLAARNRRVQPGLDDKIIVSWNGLIIGALADAGAALGNRSMIDAARRCAEHIVTDGRHADGSLARTLKGHDPKGHGVLEDHAFLASGLVRLYVATSNALWLTVAGEVLDTILERFTHEDGVGFYDTADDHDELIIRPRDLQDGAIPCGTSVTAGLLVTFAAYRQDDTLSERAGQIVTGVAEAMTRYPTAFGRFLSVHERLVSGTHELAIVGPGSDARSALESTAATRYKPMTVTGFVDGSESASLPMLLDRPLPQGATAAAYLCRSHVCLPPVTSPEGLIDLQDATGS